MVERKVPPGEEFADALEKRAGVYQVQLGAEERGQLRAYYEHVSAWNARLHLVAPVSPAEFATRHVLESLLALHFLPHGAQVTDVGSGAGLPIIPCLIVRPDISATLIESSPKKAIFLREALRRVERQGAAQVVAERFEKTVTPQSNFITCRALDRFAEMFERLVAWAPPASTLLFFGGRAVREAVETASLAYTAVPVPETEQRFLFVIQRPELDRPIRTE